MAFKNLSNLSLDNTGSAILFYSGYFPYDPQKNLGEIPYIMTYPTLLTLYIITFSYCVHLHYFYYAFKKMD